MSPEEFRKAQERQRLKRKLQESGEKEPLSRDEKSSTEDAQHVNRKRKHSSSSSSSSRKQKRPKTEGEVSPTGSPTNLTFFTEDQYLRFQQEREEPDKKFYGQENGKSEKEKKGKISEIMDFEDDKSGNDMKSDFDIQNSVLTLEKSPVIKKEEEDGDEDDKKSHRKHKHKHKHSSTTTSRHKSKSTSSTSTSTKKDRKLDSSEKESEKKRKSESNDKKEEKREFKPEPEKEKGVSLHAKSGKSLKY